MYIIPYYIEKKQSKDLGATLWTAWIFLSGETLWKTDEDKITKKQIIDTYLVPNGFVGKCVCLKGDTMYYQVDPFSMNMSEFYSWKDFLEKAQRIPEGIQVWRPFFWVGGDSTSEGDQFCWKRHPFLNDFWPLVLDKEV